VNAVADEIHCCRSRKIQVALALGVPDINAVAAHSQGIRFAKRPAKRGTAKVLSSDCRFSHSAIIGLEDFSVKADVKRQSLNLFLQSDFCNLTSDFGRLSCCGSLYKLPVIGPQLVAQMWRKSGL